ncbi:MAG: radical SAM protein [Lachnospiraceae bacterium]|nr:radical SAM protein [Lachnospiraceae bacterium]
MKWKNKGHEFDEIKSIFSKENIRCYIWGAGTFGYAFCNEFVNQITIEGFIDSNPMKQGGVFCEKKVYSPEDFFSRRTDELVLVSTGWTNQVYSQLNNHGMKRFVDYYHIDEWYSLFHYFRNNKVFLTDLTIQITQKCTLRCEYCNAFIPHIKQPKDLSTEQVMKSLDNLFKWVDSINVIALSGGDAMASRNFVDVLDSVAKKYYPQKVKHIEVYSNAVIVPDEITLEKFKQYNVIYRWTDYYGNSGHQKNDEIEHILSDRGIIYDRVRFKEWYDCGYPQESNGLYNEDELIDFCTQCKRKSCHIIREDKLFTCGMCSAADDIGYCFFDETDYFDLHNHNNSPIELIEFYLGFSEKGYYNYCRKCNGGTNIAKKSIPVGNQLKKI